jgi:hypothetical protein
MYIYIQDNIISPGNESINISNFVSLMYQRIRWSCCSSGGSERHAIYYKETGEKIIGLKFPYNARSSFCSG